MGMLKFYDWLIAAADICCGCGLPVYNILISILIKKNVVFSAVSYL